MSNKNNFSDDEFLPMEEMEQAKKGAKEAEANAALIMTAGEVYKAFIEASQSIANPFGKIGDSELPGLTDAFNDACNFLSNEFRKHTR